MIQENFEPGRDIKNEQQCCLLSIIFKCLKIIKNSLSSERVNLIKSVSNDKIAMYTKLWYLYIWLRFTIIKVKSKNNWKKSARIINF